MSSCQVIETTFFISKNRVYSDKLWSSIEIGKARRRMRQASSGNKEKTRCNGSRRKIAAEKVGDRAGDCHFDTGKRYWRT